MRCMAAVRQVCLSMLCILCLPTRQIGCRLDVLELQDLLHLQVCAARHTLDIPSACTGAAEGLHAVHAAGHLQLLGSSQA